jgi:4-alpha-glucanotransferase
MDFLKHKLENTPLSAQWKRIGIRPHKGIDLPLSALHSKQGCGIGEFFDLIALIEWCSSINIDTIQLLPLNDSGLDPSPYNALSSCALHPIYLSLHHLPNVHCHKELLLEIKKIKQLNLLPRIPFGEVHKQKMDFLSLYLKKEKQSILSSSDFVSFMQENPWVKPYALFKVLKDKNNQTHFCFWPDSQNNLSAERFEQLCGEFLTEVSFYMVLQYLCFVQLKYVKKKAEEHKILLKGDIPILISPDSADVWFEPHLFDLQISIGVPPDFYNAEGQYWGFPKPNWHIMRNNGFSWWKTRLKCASNFYDIYRIDHAVGLFRLWMIQTGRPSSEGHYEPYDQDSWEPLGRELLQVFIESSPMLPIAEDLGSVPQMVRNVLEELGIPGTKVMRWEKDEYGRFINPKSYPPISLTCISTHDSTTLEQWWSDESSEAADYAKEQGWDYDPPLLYEYRKSILKSSLESRSLFHINLFSEYLALIPDLVFEDPKDERINIPGTLLPSNWTYKFRRPLEDIISHPLLQKEMRDLFAP